MVYSGKEIVMDPHTALETLPQSPGVYIYKDKRNNVIYVGKGVNLKKRVMQYFARDDAVGEKTRQLVSQIADIVTIQTMNEFDALLLEAKLIREYLPKYNVISRDDKSPLFVHLTLEENLPRVLFVRRPKTPAKGAIFGPFQSAFVVRDLLRSLRRIVPYCTAKQRNGKPCFYTHLGLCNPCPSVIAKLPDGDKKRELTRGYRKNIFILRDILSGKGNHILSQLQKEMKQAAGQNDFEKAAILRNQLQHLAYMLQKHYEPGLYLEGEGAEDIFAKEERELTRVLTPVYPNLSSLHRVECVDISNLGGKQAVGSLVVLVDGKPDSSEYRKFKIRMPNTPNDVAMVAEVVGRRLKHTRWPYPDLLVIDGGKGQVGMAIRVLRERNVAIPVIGLAKRREEIIVPKLRSLSFPRRRESIHAVQNPTMDPGLRRDDNRQSSEFEFVAIRLPLTSPGLHLLERIRDEAHRFAITYHRLLRRKQSLGV